MMPAKKKPTTGLGGRAVSAAQRPASTRSKAATDAPPAAVGLGEFVGTAPSGPDAKSAAERALRAFDLDTKYGPCACISRRARWERAAALGLDPPHEVLRLLDVPGVKQEGLWYGRLLAVAHTPTPMSAAPQPADVDATADPATTQRAANDENAAPARTHPRGHASGDACPAAPSTDTPGGGGGDASGGSGGGAARRKRQRYEPYRDDRAASKAMYKQKATLVTRAHALAAATGAEVYLFVAGPSGRSWQYATPRLAAAAAGVVTPAVAAVTAGGAEAAAAPSPLLTRHGDAGGNGGAVAALLRSAVGAAAGPALPHGPAPRTETMADPPGGVPDLMGGGGVGVGPSVPSVPERQAGVEGGEHGGGGGSGRGASPLTHHPSHTHRPWPGAAALATGPDGHPVLTLAP